MSSDKKIEANRRNAQRSTGPKTSAGKTRAAQNAITHGLTARRFLLPWEDAEAFADLIAGFDAEYCPMGAVETALVYEAAGCTWRLQRAHEMEADRIGIRTMAASGYDPDGMASFFARLHPLIRRSAAMASVIRSKCSHQINVTGRRDQV